MSPRRCVLAVGSLLLVLFAPLAFAHGVAGGDAAYLERIEGVHFIPLMYLGAKHMVTGYDHLLFLAGVIFFLYRIKDVALYVTLFAVGHSMTLLFGVLAGIHANAYIVDAIIGLSVVYKALREHRRIRAPGHQVRYALRPCCCSDSRTDSVCRPSCRICRCPRTGCVPNMIAFNIGVELGQFAALALILIAFNVWRRSGTFVRTRTPPTW